MTNVHTGIGEGGIGVTVGLGVVAGIGVKVGVTGTRVFVGTLVGGSIVGANAIAVVGVAKGT